MKNNMVGVGVWENNREDGEDSATQVKYDFFKKMAPICEVINMTPLNVFVCCQVVALEMQRGDQVYLELMSGRKLCTRLQYNIFTGYMLYPYFDQ